MIGDVQIDLEVGIDDSVEEQSTNRSAIASRPSMLQSGRPSSSETADNRSSEKKEEEAAVCELCCDERVSVQMNPCNHSVCETCWHRLVPESEQVSADSSVARMCPWDRELVVKW